jgi:hypothetical protein
MKSNFLSFKYTIPFNDLMIWKMFVENFNGTYFILDDTWLSNFDMQLTVLVA